MTQHSTGASTVAAEDPISSGYSVALRFNPVCWAFLIGELVIWTTMAMHIYHFSIIWNTVSPRISSMGTLYTPGKNGRFLGTEEISGMGKGFCASSRPVTGKARMFALGREEIWRRCALDHMFSSALR